MSIDQSFIDRLSTTLAGQFVSLTTGVDMPVLELTAEQLLPVCNLLKTQADLDFATLIDVTAVDYSEYGAAEWRTRDTTGSGFSRAVVEPEVAHPKMCEWRKSRYSVVYHLLSLSQNQRVRIHVFLETKNLKVPSVVSVWPAANWFEREAYDLFGIVFTGHPDLRRILTDYGFVGHPFRKDFPLIGQVELRYDAQERRCVYQPVSIQPRVLVPKVIRDDNRYKSDETLVGTQ